MEEEEILEDAVEDVQEARDVMLEAEDTMVEILEEDRELKEMENIRNGWYPVIGLDTFFWMRIESIRRHLFFPKILPIESTHRGKYKCDAIRYEILIF